MPTTAPQPDIACARINPKLGSFAANAAQILQAASALAANQPRLLLCPELALSGAMPSAWAERHDFIAAQMSALQQLAQDLAAMAPKVAVLVGHLDGMGSSSASLLQNGQVQPCWSDCGADYGPAQIVFAQKRYQVVLGSSLARSLPDAQAADATLLLDAAPYALASPAEAQDNLAALAAAWQQPIYANNLAGAQDEWVFDGQALWATPQGECQVLRPAFDQADKADRHSDTDADDAALAQLWFALCTGLGDYVRKNGFGQVALGLSGGIDSALAAVLALDALGQGSAVHCLMMPSPYTAAISVADARALAERCAMPYDEIAIDSSFNALQTALAPLFEGRPADVTEENMQARIRGLMTMALSNKTGALVLTCSNKSEVATGYSTLYGDMCGGYAPLKDVLKTQVFALARWRNRHNPLGTVAQPIPERIISRPPSAELRPDQADSDSLPDYPVLDAIIQAYMQGADAAEISASGLPAAAVQQVLRLIRSNEHKRAQGALGPRVSGRSFGPDWGFPVSCGFRPEAL